MPCNKCHECRERGDKFCIYCGEMLDGPAPGYDQKCIGGFCDMCERSRMMGYTYCTRCGRKLKNDENILLTIGFYVGCVTAMVLTCLVLFEYAVAIWGIPQVLPKIGDAGSTLILVIPKIINIISFNGVLSQIYYILLFIAVSVCLALYLYKAYGPVMELAEGNNEPIKSTALFEVPVLFAVLFFWEYIYAFILTLMGVDMGKLPEMDTWKWLYELLEASVWEEVITRILLIGLPTVIIALAWKHEGRTSWKYLFGGFGFSKVSLVLIVFSAFIFGAGHLENWGSWKFFTTFAFGLIAGYLFCRYGVYATIIMHFMTDYMSAEEWLLGSSAPIMTTLLIMLISFACVPYTYIYLKKGVLGIRDLFRSSEQ